jgi:hypothetical protein
MSDFSGLLSSACALASAAAIAPIDSLDRCMAVVQAQNIEAHGARPRSLGSEAMPDRLLGILRHQGFELAFCPLMVEEGSPGMAEQRCKLGPGIRRIHIDDADGLDAWTTSFLPGSMSLTDSMNGDFRA